MNQIEEDILRDKAADLIENSPSEAADIFYKLIKENRAAYEDYMDLAEICTKQNRLAEAFHWVEKAKRLRECGVTFLGFADIYAKLKDVDETLKYLAEAAEWDDVFLPDLKTNADYEFLYDNPKFNIILQTPAEI